MAGTRYFKAVVNAVNILLLAYQKLPIKLGEKDGGIQAWDSPYARILTGYTKKAGSLGQGQPGPEDD